MTCPTNIDVPYVDGVSITHGASPREHIWTYAAAHDGNQAHPSSCPCTDRGASSPAFVGSDYYCESGVNTGSWSLVLYPNDPLWDGQGCDGLEHTCCDPPNLPWLRKELPRPTTGKLEFRICGDHAPSNEDTPTDLAQLYIQ